MGKTFGYEIEVMERSIPQIFSEMFAVNVIEITGPDGQVKIWDKASKRKAGQPTNEKSPTPN